MLTVEFVEMLERRMRTPGFDPSDFGLGVLGIRYASVRLQDKNGDGSCSEYLLAVSVDIMSGDVSTYEGCDCGYGHDVDIDDDAIGRLLGAYVEGDVLGQGNFSDLSEHPALSELIAAILAGRPIGPCEWFALCPNDAVKLRRHPIYHAVPTCQRCDDKAKRMSA